MFQSAPLREGRPGRAAVSAAQGVFQSAPLREGRPLPAGNVAVFDVHLFQSAPLREGRLGGGDNYLLKDSPRVSIRAPA